MKRFLFFALLILSLNCAFAEVRKPVVAGSFYPANKDELAYQVNKFLLNVPSQEIKGEIVALVVPHAGYPFSGQVAAYAYKQLEGKSYETIILIGASHRLAFDEIAVPAYDTFETPLGRVPVDRDFIRKLTKLSDRIKVNNEPFKQEDNSLEVQLPFLQTVQKDFKIVPIFFGNVSLANCQALAYALNLLIGENTLIIASSDWSHYYPYDLARKLDNKGIEAVVNNDLEGYVKCLAEGETEACGAPAIITTMMLAPALGANKVELLKYANSGDVTDDRSRVVGYAAIVFYHQELFLSAADKKELLRIARRTIESRLAGKKIPQFKPAEGALTENRGAFVTLSEEGKLRGCIGYIQPVKPLYLAVQEMAVEAATGDPRFDPVKRSEFKNIKIEISALSRLKKLKDVAEIEIGRDGLFIVKGNNSGLLLPQVAVEWGWGREEFLKQVCVKAGLPEDAWQAKDAVLYHFTADVFHE
ncbi:MAG: AmmeMemoRadiSam system protein B [Candidatus Margulisbacteria bacterium]|nr:AmmeMemoRadiSam system protein B [Candidatus Margulisiibacteriota bacterium]